MGSPCSLLLRTSAHAVMHLNRPVLCLRGLPPPDSLFVWCTKARFQIIASCLFCDHEYGVNSLKHILHCRITWDLFKSASCGPEESYSPACHFADLPKTWNTQRRVLAALPNPPNQ